MDFLQDTARWQKIILCVYTTERVEDLDQQSEMIIFESILTTFETCNIFETAVAVAKISLSPNPSQPNQF